MCLEKEEIDYNVFREYTFHLLQIIRQYLQYTFRRRLVHCLWQSIVLYVVTETFPHTLGILQAHGNRSLVILDQRMCFLIYQHISSYFIRLFFQQEKSQNALEDLQNY